MDNEPGGLRRVLGPMDATCVVVGAVIGVGIFFTPGLVARVSGSAGMSLLVWALAGGITLLGAITFARLGAMYTRSGGQYEIIRDAWGAPPAFLFVFCNATAIQAGATAIIAAVCAQHLGIAAGAELRPPVLTALAVVLIAGLAAANAAGVTWGAGIQNATALAKVATLIAVAALGALYGAADGGGRAEARSPGPLAPGAAIFAALVPAFFSYGGWQQALWIAGEVRRPKRDVPLAIITGVLIVVAVYLLANWAYVRLLGQAGVAGSSAVAADAAARVWPWGGRLAAAAVAVSAFGVLNAQLLAGPRLVYAMARDGRFFAPFARAPARFGTPIPAILLIAGMSLVLLLAAGRDAIDRIVTGVVVVDCVFFALTAAALPVLRRRFSPVAALFVAGELCVIAGALLDPGKRAAAAVGAAWIAAGALCYAIFFRGTPSRAGLVQ